MECKKKGIRSIGIEANVMAWFASEVKVDWALNPGELLGGSIGVAEYAREILDRDGIVDGVALNAEQAIRDPDVLRVLSPETIKLLLANCISPLPLHKFLVLMECLEKHGNPLAS